MASGSDESRRPTREDASEDGSVSPVESENERSPESGPSPQDTDASDSDEHGQDLLGLPPPPRGQRGQRGVIYSPGLSQIVEISRERERARRRRAEAAEAAEAGPSQRAHNPADDGIAIRQRSRPLDDERSHASNSTRTLQAADTGAGGSAYAGQNPRSLGESSHTASTRTMQGTYVDRSGSVYSAATSRSDAPTPHTPGQRSGTRSTHTPQEADVASVGSDNDEEAAAAEESSVPEPAPTSQHVPYFSPLPEPLSPYHDAPTPRIWESAPIPVQSPSSGGSPTRERRQYVRDSADTESPGRLALHEDDNDALSEATTVRLSEEHDDVVGRRARVPSMTPSLTDAGTASTPSSSRRSTP